MRSMYVGSSMTKSQSIRDCLPKYMYTNDSEKTPKKFKKKDKDMTFDVILAFL